MNVYNTTYLYDPAGIRTVKNASGALTSYSYNVANEITLLAPPTGQPTTSIWDAIGNLLSENAGGQFTSYSWDLRRESRTNDLARASRREVLFHEHYPTGRRGQVIDRVVPPDNVSRRPRLSSMSQKPGIRTVRRGCNCQHQGGKGQGWTARPAYANSRLNRRQVEQARGC